MSSIAPEPADRGMHYSLPHSENAPQRLQEMVDKLDEDMCKSWREEIDTLLVFTGLFSAVVTAFSVFTLPWMQEQSPDDTYLLLHHISAQLQPLNPSIALLPVPAATAISPIDVHVARLVNSLWLASLSLALSASMICILCKQWINSFKNASNRDPLTSLAIRHVRFRGIRAFYLPHTISSLSLVLQAALGLFVIGLCALVWELDCACAVALVALSCMVAAFYLFTTFFPVIQYLFIIFKRTFDTLPSQCPWKSPQSWLFVRVANLAIRVGIESALGGVAENYIDAVNWMPAPWTQRMSKMKGGPRMEDKVGCPLSQNLQSWTFYDVLWTRQHEESDAGLVAGPSPSSAVSGSLIWAVECITTSEVPFLVYHTLRQSTAQWSTRCAGLVIPRIREAQYQLAYSTWLKKVHRKDPNIVLSNGLYATQFMNREDGVGYHDLASPVFDIPLECTAYPQSYCASHFTTSDTLDLLKIRGEVGLEHTLRFMGAHLRHAQVHYSVGENHTSQADLTAISEGAHPNYLAHVEAVISKSDTENHDSSYWYPVDEMLLRDCVLPLLSRGTLRCSVYSDAAFSLPKGQLRLVDALRVEYLPQAIRYYLMRLRQEPVSATSAIGCIMEALSTQLIRSLHTIDDKTTPMIVGLRRMFLELHEEHPEFRVGMMRFPVLLLHYATMIREPQVNQHPLWRRWFWLVNTSLSPGARIEETMCPSAATVFSVLSMEMGLALFVPLPDEPLVFEEYR